MARKKINKPEEDAILVTQQGYDKLLAELEERKKTREVIAREIDEARDLGDLSENASYKDAMERKELNENRIDEVELILNQARIVESSDNDKVVRIGRSIEIQNLDNSEKKIIHIVGATEADPLKNMVSSESPMGKSFINSQVGDTTEVTLPGGLVTKYKIVKFTDK